MDDEKIKELNSFISLELAEISKICILADTSCIGKAFRYDDTDLFNAFYVFLHVWQNRAIHDKFITFTNVDDKINILTNAIEECFGIDVRELAESASDGIEEHIKKMN